MKTAIQNILSTVVPNAFVQVEERNTFYGSPYLKIVIAACDAEINNVKGQYPACVSLSLDLGTLELVPQIFGGMGGQMIYRNPDKSVESERYLAMKGIKIPFRKPKNESKFVLAAIERFATNWKAAIAENLNELTHQDLCDYSKLI